MRQGWKRRRPQETGARTSRPESTLVPGLERAATSEEGVSHGGGQDVRERQEPRKTPIVSRQVPPLAKKRTAMGRSGFWRKTRSTTEKHH